MWSAIWASKAAHYWVLACLASFTLFSYSAFSSVGRTRAQYVQQQDHPGNGRRFQAFELEGVSIAEPFPPFPATLNAAVRLNWLLDTFIERVQTVSNHQIVQPTCNLDRERFAPVLRSYQARAAHPISIAINLRNSQHILPAQCKALLTAIFYLLPTHHVYLSIFENDSGDATPLILGQLASAIDRLGIDGLWITSSRLHSGINVANRINKLSEVRNAALRPLLPYAGTGTVVFINDVILCASDILELITQLQVQSADVAIGMDWADSSSVGPSPPYVYDAWVLRGINGQMVYEQGTTDPWPVPPPDGRDWITNAFVTQSTQIQERWLNTLPFPVYAGWGGIAVLRASLFTVDGLRFRSTAAAGWTGGSASGSMGAWGKLVTDPEYMAGDCPGDSECGLVMRDIWNLRKGSARVVLAPQVSTAYDMPVWEASHAFLPFVPRKGLIDQIELIDWAPVSIPREVTCMPGMTADGQPHDAHDINLFRYLTLDPLYEAAPTSAAVSRAR